MDVENVEDQKLLLKFVVGSYGFTVRQKAFNKLSDKTLFDIVKNHNDCNLRIEAIGKITDKDILTQITNSNNSNRYICEYLIPVGDDYWAHGEKQTLDLRKKAREKLLGLQEN